MKKTWLFTTALLLFVSLSALMTVSCSSTRETVDTGRPTYQEVLREQEERQAQQEDRDAWIEARAANTIDALQAYLDDFPEGRYRRDANVLISDLRVQERPEPEPEPEPAVESAFERQIREHDEAWEQAGRANTIEAFNNYLKMFPSGQFRSIALNKIQELEDTKREQQAREADPFFDSMVRVMGGSFTMGCIALPEDDVCARNEFGNELPHHRVTVSDFYIGKHPVTQRQWREIMGNNPSSASCTNCPVTDVSWNDVQLFISRLNHKTGLNYRLPTEAEWEFAARGGLRSRNVPWAGNNDPNRVAIFDETSNYKLGPVGQKAPNELGLYDMSGLVYEWCYDWYAAYTAVDKTNPRGPSSGLWRINRGGSFLVSRNHCRVSHREYRPPDDRTPSLGFRLARDI